MSSRVASGVCSIIALAVMGCASTPAVTQPYWAGRDQALLRRDHYECTVDALAAARTSPQVRIGTAVPVTRGLAVGSSVPVSDDPVSVFYSACMRRRGHVLVIPRDWAEEQNKWLQASCRNRDGGSFGPERCVAEGTIVPIEAPPGYQPLQLE